MPPNTADERDPADDDDALDWNPVSTVAGSGYVPSDFGRELERHLPETWTVERFEMWDPSKLNHGGGGGYDGRVEHPSGAAVEIEPDTTWDEDADRPTVYNSHAVWVIDEDGDREQVEDARSMIHRDSESRAAWTLAAVVEAAEQVDEPPVQQGLDAY